MLGNKASYGFRSTSVMKIGPSAALLLLAALADIEAKPRTIAEKTIFAL
jgi:hypothetical protein